MLDKFDSPGRMFLRLTILATVAFALTWGEFLLTRAGGSVPAVWMANAVMLFVLARRPMSSWPAFVAAGMAGEVGARCLSGVPAWGLVAFPLFNLVEILACAIPLRRLAGDDLDLDRARHLVLFFATATLAPAISGLLAATAFHLGADASALSVFGRWYPAHALGLLVLTPVLLKIATCSPRVLAAELARGRRLAVLLALAVSLALVFGQDRAPLLFLVVPAVVAAAFTLSPAAVALALLATFAVTLGATVLGHGPAPLIQGSLAQRLFVVQLFLATTTLVGLSLTAVLASRRRLEESLRESTARSEILAAALASSERYYRVLTTNASDVIACFDLQARFTYLSPAITPLLGYRPEELIGKTTGAIMHPEDYKRALAMFSAHMAGPTPTDPFEFEYRAFRKDGTEVWLSAHPRAVVDETSGELVEFQDCVRDITQRKALEAELAAARDAAEAAARVKADFMANMSHEIRTPLTAILGFTSLLSTRQDLSAEARHQVDRVATGSQTLLSIVNDILDFSKLEAGRVAILPRPAALLETFSETLSLFEPQAAAKGLELRLACGELPIAHIDATRLRQVLLNLIGNAVKFTETGSVTLGATYDPQAGRLRVRVEDTGIGIDPVHQAALFQRFHQVDGSMTRRQGGTGLGLAICRGLVEAMGGEIGIASQPGVGSSVQFEIDAPACAVGEALGPDEDAADLSGVRVLVVDDNPLNLELVSALLVPLGAEVSEAADGLEAVEAAMTMPFDVILMDLRMPRLDGAAATLQLRQRPGPNQAVPILAFSADFDPDTLIDQAPAGFDGHVGKPIQRGQLIRAVAAAAATDFDQLTIGAVA